MIRSTVLLTILSILLAACGGGGGGGSDAEFIDDRVLLENIRVASATSSLAVGQAQTYNATGEYSDGSEQNLTSSVSWSSSATNVASIDAAGLVSAVSIGESTITASLDGVSGSASLTVTEPVVVETTILPPIADIPLGGTQDYRAFAIYSDGSFENVTFTAEWALQNESGIIEAYEPVLTRGLNALDDFGTVIGVELGEDALLASVDGIQSQAEVVVIDPQLIGLSISPRDETIPAGATLNYTATGSYSDGTNTDLTKVVTWSSSHPDIASISNQAGERGFASGQSPGEAVISAAFESFGDNTTLTVIDDGGDEVIRVDVLPPTATIGIGESETYTAIALTRDGDTFDVTDDVNWSSSNDGVATISASGIANGISGGSVTISAIFETITGTATLNVEAEIILDAISISPENPTLVSLTRSNFIARGLYSDGSSRDLTSDVTWQSSDRSILVVSNDPEFGHGSGFALLPGETVLTATLSGIIGQTNVTVIAPDESPAQLVVSPPVAQVPIDGTQQYTAEIVFKGRSALDVTDAVSWSSLNSLIAEVDASGLAKGLNTGSATIQATLTLGEFSVSATGVLQVLPAPVTVQEIVVSPPNASIIVGDNQAYTARALLSDNSDVDITTDVSWSTDNGAIAVISLDGIATGVAPGTTEIKARLKIGGSIFEDSVTLNVVAPALTSLEVSPPRVEVLAGTSVAFTAQAYFENGTSEDVTSLVAWSTSDGSIANVDATGLATAIAPGAADISANVSYQGNNYSDSGRLIVKEEPVTIVELLVDPATAEVLVEGQQSFTARVLLSDSTDQDVTDQVSWISGDTSIASVNGQGRATGVSPGETAIEAALFFDGQTYSDNAVLTVLPPLVTIESLVVDPPASTILVDGTSQFSARVNLSDNTSQDVSDQVSWISGAPEVAHVNSTGLATGLAEGKSDISATLIYEGQTFTDSGRLTVNPEAITIEEVRVLPVSASVFVDGKTQFMAEAVLSDDTVVDITNDVSWLAVNGDIASINATGRATGLAPGQSAINATLSYEGDTFTGTATLTVNPPEVTVEQLIVEPVRSQVLVGSSQQFTARLVFSDSTQQIVTDSATWSSSDSSVASVSMGLANGLAPGASEISAAVTVDGNQYSDSGRLTVNEPASVVTGIRVDPDNAEILIGTTQQYLASAIYNDGTESDITRDVTWTLNDSAIAHISSTGLATGVAAGAVIVNATFTSGITSFSDTASLTVQALPVTVTELVIAPETAEVLIDGTVAFTAIAKLSDNTEQDVTNNVAWVSGQPNIAQIDSAGIATGIAEGEAAIKAQLTYGDGETIKDSVSLAVKAPLVTVDSISIAPDSADVLVGESTRYTATALLSDSSELDVSRDVTWTVADAGIASVNMSGLATGLAMGSTSINAALATANGPVSDAANINVTEPPPVLVRVDVFPPTVSMPLGTTQDFRAVAVFDDDSTENVTFDGTWSLSKQPPILERYEPANSFGLGALDDFGTALAINVGNDTLSFDYEGFTGTSTVEVSEPLLESITISPRTVTTAVGIDIQFTASGSYDNGTSRDITDSVTWSSSDTAIASISNTSPTRGMATTLTLGVTNISATQGGVTDSTTLTVNSDPLTRIDIIPAAATLPVDGRLQYLAQAVYASGLTEDVTDQSTWTVGEGSIATIDSSGSLTAIAEGNTAVSASFNDVSGSGQLTVSGTLTLLGLTIEPASTSVLEFQTIQYQAFGQYNDGSSRNITTEVTWSSDDTTVFAISNDEATFGKGLGIGLTPEQSTLVNAIMPGTSIAGSADISVIPLGDDIRKLEVTPVTSEILIGESQQYQADLFLTDGSQVDVTNYVVWSSADDAIATIDGNGLAFGEAAGTATVQASLFQLTDLSDSASLTVKAPVTIEDIVVSPPSATVLEGETASYTAEALLSDNTSIDVTQSASWSSGDINIASAAAGGIATGVAEGTTTVIATVQYEGQNYQGSANIDVLPVVVIEEIIVDPGIAEILEGGSLQYTATARLSDGMNIPVTEDVNWQSANSNVATISSSGAAIGIAGGTTTITASLVYENVTYSGTAELTVRTITIESIVIEPKSLTTLPGNSVQFSAQAILTDMSVVDVTNQATWFTTNDSVAVIESGDNAGQATGIGEGTVTVYVELTYDGVDIPCLGITSCVASLEVKALEVTGIQVTPSVAEIDTGATLAYTARAILNNGESVDATEQVTWQSSDKNIASVNASGLAQGVTEGEVTITASVIDGTDTISGTAALTVLPPPVTIEEIVVSPADITILTGGTQAYTATAILSDSTNRDVTSFASWFSSDKATAIISANGIANGVAAGATTIEAQVNYEGVVYSGNTPLTVENPTTLVSVKVTPVLSNILTGEQTQFAATATLSNGDRVDVTDEALWYTGNSDVAAVGIKSTAGLVVGTGAGKTEVWADYTYNGDTYTCEGNADCEANITVSDPVVVERIIVNPATASRIIGTTIQFTALAELSDSSVIDVTDSVTWASSNDSVAAPQTTTGLFVAVSPGSTTITATGNYDGVSLSDSAALLVEPEPVVVDRIEVTPASASKFIGETQAFVATAFLSNGDNLDVTTDSTWQSSDSAVISIAPATGIAKAVTAGMVTITASFTYQGDVANGTASMTSESPVLESIDLAPLDAMIVAGEIVQYTATGNYSDGSSVPLSSPTWTSSDTSIANIDSTGLATALAGGSTNISVSEDGISAATTLTVADKMIDDLWIFPSSIDDAAGTLGRLSAVAHFNDNTTEVVTQQGVWTTDNPDLLTIVDTRPLKGGYALKLPGSTSITVDYMGFTDTIPVTISDPALVQIVVTPLVETTPVGVEATFIATGLYANLTTSDLTDDVVWASSDPAISEITETGLATGLSEGTVTISAGFDGLTGEATHEVTTAVVNGLTITPPEFAGPAGTTKPFQAFAQYSNGTQQEVTAQVAWTSSDEQIVVIGNQGAEEAPGVAELISAGNVLITATFESFEATAPIEVTEPAVVDLFVNPYGETYPSGLLVEFTAIATYDNGTDADVTADAVWHSTNGDVIVANPESPGQFQTVAPGEAEVTATFAEILEDSPVTVTPAQVIELQIEPADPEGPVGTQDQLTATAFYDNLTREDVTDQAAWSSSNPAIVNVIPSGEDQGFIQFIDQGTAEISATFEGVTQSVTATATEAVLIDIIVQPPNEKIAKGLTRQYEAIGIYSDGSSTPLINAGNILSRVLTDEVAWSTGSSDIAQVTADGLVTTVNIGSTNVSASFGGLIGTTDLEVISATVTALEIQPISNSGPVGTDEPVTAIATLTDQSTLDVSDLVVWGSSSGFVATVAYDTDTGLALLSYNNQGTATISATLGEGDSAIVANAEAITTAATLERIEVLPNPQTMPAGTKRPLVATGFFSDGSIQFLNDDADFTSGDPTIATVTQLGVASGVSLGTTTIIASLGDISGSTQVTVTDAVLVSLQITPADVIGPAGTEQRLEATGLYSNGDTQPLTTQVTWRSDDTMVASITSSGEEAGLLRLIATGTTEIAAVFDEVVDTINVEVTEAALTGIRIQPVASLMPAGTSQQMAAFGDYSDGSSQDITLGVTWRSGNTDSVQIDSNGIASAFDQGISTIRATLDDLGGIAEILVTSPSLVNLQITPSTLVEPAGSSGQFTATGVYSTGLERDLTAEVIWESSDTETVTVNNLVNPGLARLIQPGTVNVTASLDGISDSVPVEVTNAVLQSIRVSPSLESVAEGTEVQYSAIGEFTDGSTTPIDDDVSWSTSNTVIATINSDGLADTVGEGEVEIRAATQDLIGTAVLEVTDAVPTRLDINPSSSPALLVGQTRQYEALLTYTDGESAVVTGQVTWIVEPSNIATTTATSGLIQGIEEGTGEVIARFTSNAFGKASTTLEDRVPLEVDTPSIVSVEINTFRETGQPVEIPAGRTEAWQAFANFSDGTFVEITDDAIWTSTNQGVATVLDGNVDALVSGTTNISILYINLDGTFQAPRVQLQDLTDSVSLTVTSAQLTSIDINPDDAIVAPEQTATFTAIGNFSDGSSQNITADSNWSVTNGDIAAIDRVTDTATVRGLEVGTTNVTVNQSGISASASIEVTDAQIPTTLEVSSALPVSVGSQWPFTATITYSDGDTAVVTNDATWNSSDTIVATVYNAPDEDTPRGTAFAEAEGTTTITANFEGIDGSADFQVTPACEASSPNGKPDSVFIIPEEPVLPNIGDTIQMQAIGVFVADCQLSLTLDPQTQWKVTGQGGSNKVIEVNEQGVVTGLKCGTGEVEANHRGVKATMAVQVCE